MEEAYWEELRLLKDMNIYKLIPLDQVPAGHKVQRGWLVFKIKYDEDGKPVHHKVCLMYKGFKQIYGRDYTKTTSPTAHMGSWHILLHLAAAKVLHISMSKLHSYMAYFLTTKSSTCSNLKDLRNLVRKTGSGTYFVACMA